MDEYYTGIWNPAESRVEPIVGILFDANSRLYAWTKEGRVYIRPNPTPDNTDPSWSLMLDIQSEVKSGFDGGMLGFVLDPDFFTNGFFYVYYSTYVSGGSEPDAAVGRVRRFKANNPNHATQLPTTDYSSPLNLILIGESDSTGIPITKLSHMGGTLVFGTDNSLIISTGDGAYYSNDDDGSHPGTAYQECLDLGVMTVAENIGANRSQFLNSHCGKLLRIDPATGNGLPSNPFYSTDYPRSAQSRVWARGFRNPFRIMHIPLTGNHIDDPGDFFVGDVGQEDKEEYNIVTQGGQNFGWPHNEGMDLTHPRLPEYIPLNPQKPIIDYRSGSGRAIKNNTIFNIGSANVPGINPMEGRSAIAGIYYDKDTYPTEYKNTYFVADVEGTIFNIKLDADYNVHYVNRFGYNLPSIVSVAIHPMEGNIYYLEYSPSGSSIHRIRYSPSNRPPIAKIKADILSGNSPQVVAFSALDSYDPDDQELTYAWNFGDGSPAATSLAPHHKFTNTAQTTYKVKLMVTDPNGEKGYDSLYVSINNAPPVITGSSIHPLNMINANEPYNLILTASATDDHTAANQLNYVWKLMLAHNDHEHLYTTYTGNNRNITLPALECTSGLATYWYRMYLIVTDQQGLSTTYTKDINLNCIGIQQIITFPAIPDKQTTDPIFLLNATASSALPVYYYSVSGPATVGGNTVSLTGRPGQVRIRAAQHGNSVYSQAPITERVFNVTRPITQQSVTFDSIFPKLITSPAFTLNATSSSGLPIEYLIISGPATLSGGNLITLTGQEGTVRVRAIQAGSYSVNGAYKERTFAVTDPCPSTLTLSQTISGGAPIIYQAGQLIHAANVIQNGSNAVYRAGASIELNPGFQVQTGAVFKAYIQGCH
ncbi:PQQ-dependent sugar dehydrogenase [Runella slithyformis]|uniref:PQQ-dependent sugar dehydrogenase n=1 Tax=Runella slithyformis TaxID=106 RepID=UPI00059DA57D|nr:PQQ-dependent sugar dehydrogenase [Runella slithyformis]